MADIAPDFQPAALIELLNRHWVRYVVVGGLAGALHGSPSVTQDVDICYARDAQNLQALTDALMEIHARLRGVSEEVPFRLDARTLAEGDSFTLTTDLGWLDILGTPSGTGGYDDLVSAADEVEALGQSFLIAGLEDLIRMKRAAGRPRDLAELEILGALQEELDRSEAK